MKISSSFDAGRIEVVSHDSPENIQVRIKADNASDFKQWFYFHLQGMAYQACIIHFGDISDTAYPDAWENYQAVASYDRVNWFRVPSYLEDNHFRIEHTPLSNSVYYAYFEPYSYEQHLNLIGQCSSSGLCQIDDLGSTVQGRDISLLTIGNQIASDVKVWIIARQHPGETMTEWFMEGFLSRILDYQDSLSRTLLDYATFYVVPHMNPDGAVLGNLRTNAKGVDLNRQWLEPSIDNSPEVYYVREKMHQVGVDIFLDIHGDEAIPYVFVSGTEGVPNYSAKIAQLEQEFKHAFEDVCPDFQDVHAYPKMAANQADLSKATNYIGNSFNCLAYTLEMPFKDNDNLPDDDFGWTGQRSLRMGESLLFPILQICKTLKK